MKKFIGFITALCMLCAYALPYTAFAEAGQEMLDNIGFEGVSEEGIPWWWGPISVDGADTSKTLFDETVVHEGTKSALVSERKDHSAGIMQYIQTEKVNFEPGASYKMSAAVRPAGAVNFKFTLESNGVSYEMASGAAAANEWTVIEGEFTLPESYQSMYSHVRVFTDENDTEAVDFYIDDMSVIQTKEGSGGAADDYIKKAVGKTVGNANPLMGYAFGADPFAMEYDGRVYIYMSADSIHYDENGQIQRDENGIVHGYDNIRTIKVISSADMVNWTNHGEIPVAGEVLPDGAAKWAVNSWAPAAAHKTIDGKEKFFLYFANFAAGIGVLESDSPTGPFTDPLGEPIITGSTPGCEGVAWMFDPAVFIDDDGQAYIYFGGGIPGGSNPTYEQNKNPKTARVMKLSDDMIHVEGTAETIDAPKILEDSGIHKYNGKYYYSYCTNFSNVTEYPGGTICYMMSDDPMGPFEYKGVALPSPGDFFQIWGNNHHAFFDFNGEHYITYHARTLEKAMGYGGDKTTLDCRSAHVDKVEYNEDGTIKQVTGTYPGVPIEGVTIDGTKPIEAETISYATVGTAEYEKDLGVNVKRIPDGDGGTNTDGNTMVTGVDNGSWTSVSNVDFGETTMNSVKARVRGNHEGIIYIYTDEIKSDNCAGAIIVPESSDWQEITAGVKPLSGKHDIYFVYNGAGEDLFDIDRWEFSAEQSEIVTPTAIPYSPTPTPEPVETPEPTPDPRKKVFEETFTDNSGENRCSPYEDTIVGDSAGIANGVLSYHLSKDWADNPMHGLKYDITDIVRDNKLTKFGLSADFKSSSFNAAAHLSVLIEDASGETVNSYDIDSQSSPQAEGGGTVTLSGDADIEYGDTDKVFVCITQPNGDHVYDNIIIYTNGGGDEPDASPTPEPTPDTRVVVFNDDFTTDANIDMYAPYTGSVLNSDNSSGIQYGALAYNFDTGWGENHGIRIDITDIVKDNKLSKFGASADFSCYYWGNEAPWLTADFTAEIEDAEGNVKQTVNIDAGTPENPGADGAKKVTLSGELEIEYADTDRIYLCIKQPSGNHSYDNIMIWKAADGSETEKVFTVYKPYLDGDEAVVNVMNTTGEARKVHVYAASYENGVFDSAVTASKDIASGADKQEIRVKAKSGDTVYVWDENMKPYIEKTTLGDEKLLAAWTAAQEASNMKPPVNDLSGTIMRQTIRLSDTTGDRMCITLSNQYGKTPLKINSVRFAKPLMGGMIDIGTQTPVTFGGKDAVTIAAGKTATSDVIQFVPGEDGLVTVTMEVESAPPTTEDEWGGTLLTGHECAYTTTYIKDGGTVDDITMIGAATCEKWYFIASVDVMGPSDGGVVVCLGDSITDGVGASSKDESWPSQLNAILKADPETAKLNVVNQGIGGNRVNGYSLGDRARWRYGRDVLDQPGVKYLIILEGINDIGSRDGLEITSSDAEPTTDGTIAGGVIDGYKEIIAAAKAKGIKVYGATLTPCGKSEGFYGNDNMEKMRLRINEWIKTSGEFDAVIDFSELTTDPNEPADPSKPRNMLDKYNSGDGLHPGAAGYKAMAEYIDLSLFK